MWLMLQVWRGSLWGKPVAVKLLPLMDVDERQLECLRREVAVLLHTTGECKQVGTCRQAQCPTCSLYGSRSHFLTCEDPMAP